MSMMVLVLLFFWGTAAAQQNDAPATNGQFARFKLGVTNELRSDDFFFQAALDAVEVAAPSQEAATQQKKSDTGKTQKKKSDTGKTKTNISRLPTIADSRVGYIDDAIIGSEVRIRFDAAFNYNASDRAEFLYPQYAGINGPGPGFVIAKLNFQQLYLRAEYAPKKNTRFSLFLDVPVRWIQPLSTLANTAGTNTPAPNAAGLSDVAGGFKLAAIASSNQYLTFQATAYFPSGDASRALGTNHYAFEPSLLYFRRFSDRFTLQAQVGDSHPIGGSSCPTIIPNINYPQAVCVAPPEAPPPQPPALSGSYSSFAGNVFFYGVGPSYVAYQGRTVQIAPVIELVGWSVLGGLVTQNVGTTPANSYQVAVNADGINILALKAGVRTSIGAHNSFYIGGGYMVTHSHWYQDILRVEYRYSF